MRWSPANPHPLSRCKTELVWEGKYDEFGNRRAVDVAGHNIPLQMIERIDAPRDHAAAGGQLALDLFEKKSSRLDDFRNRLIWGDNKLVLASLLAEFKGKVDLIYIDPPFDVGADFTMSLPVGDGKETLEKEQSTIEAVAYRDMWGKGTDSYLHMMYERLSLMKELLSERGSIYVHCDHRVDSLVRRVMDEIFSPERFRNQMIWWYRNSGMKAASDKFHHKHDVLYFYAKNSVFTFNGYREPLKDGDSGKRRAYKFDSKLKKPLPVYDKEGKPVYYQVGDILAGSVWDVPILQGGDENIGYPTQKPEALLERIIKASSNEGDLVADFFCGSGTTGAVAERLGRRWILADLGRFAIHTTRKRLIQLQSELHSGEKPYRAFDVYNLGRYERQWWQKKQLLGADEEHRRVVLQFHGASALEQPPSPLLHGSKGGAVCHVDGIDSIFTRDELREVAKATVGTGAKELHCLAWEFEMDLRGEANALQAALGLKIRLLTIPREILERNRKHVTFHDVASLKAEVVKGGGGVPPLDSQKKRQDAASTFDVELTEFFPSLAEVPEKELDLMNARAAESGFDFIDFWAVDFDYKHPLFVHHWQDFRTRKERALKIVSDAGHTYDTAGKHVICVKVVDVFGCETSVILEAKQ